MAPTEHRPPAGAGINDNTTPGNPTGPIWMTQQTYRLPLKLGPRTVAAACNSCC
jgi:hypothetical protein